MRLVLLGTGGYHPNDRRHTPGMFLPEPGILLDAGTSLYRLPEYLETDELDIFLTHAHLDHVVGLTYLLGIRYVHPLRRVTVHALPDKLAAIDEHLFHEALFPKRPEWESRPIEGPVPLAGGGQLTSFPLKHNGGSLGLRLDWPGHALAYVTDTTAAADAPYVEQIRGVDLLVHECYFSDAHAEHAARTGHSHTTPVAQVARQAGVGRLVLVHINPLALEDDPVGLDAARSIFAATDIGHDRMEIEF